MCLKWRFCMLGKRRRKFEVWKTNYWDNYHQLCEFSALVQAKCAAKQEVMRMPSLCNWFWMQQKTSDLAILQNIWEGNAEWANVRPYLHNPLVYLNDINIKSLSRQYLELLDSCMIISLHEASRNSPPHNIVRYDTWHRRTNPSECAKQRPEASQRRKMSVLEGTRNRKIVWKLINVLQDISKICMKLFRYECVIRCI